jgi:hypothetical protein
MRRVLIGADDSTDVKAKRGLVDAFIGSTSSLNSVG